MRLFYVYLDEKLFYCSSYMSSCRLHYVLWLPWSSNELEISHLSSTVTPQNISCDIRKGAETAAQHVRDRKVSPHIEKSQFAGNISQRFIGPPWMIYIILPDAINSLSSPRQTAVGVNSFRIARMMTSVDCEDSVAKP